MLHRYVPSHTTKLLWELTIKDLPAKTYGQRLSVGDHHSHSAFRKLVMMSLFFTWHLRGPWLHLSSRLDQLVVSLLAIASRDGLVGCLQPGQWSQLIQIPYQPNSLYTRGYDSMTISMMQERRFSYRHNLESSAISWTHNMIRRFTKSVELLRSSSM